MKIHEENVKFCHYFNNLENCPYQEFGCKFKHEISPTCHFNKKCKRSKCQYRHSSNDHCAENENVLEPVNKYTDVVNDSDDCEAALYIEKYNYDYNNLICENYCGSDDISGPGFHACSTNEFNELKGIKVSNISEKFDGDLYDFIKTFPCNVCEFFDHDQDSIVKHIKEKHSNIQFKIGCLCDKCKVKFDDPEDMIKHLKSDHVKLMKKLVEIYKENN